MWDRHDPERLEQRIRVERDGTITALSGKIDFGQGIRTAFAQIVADEIDVPIERVNVVLGDTDQVPFDFGTFGSHSVARKRRSSGRRPPSRGISSSIARARSSAFLVKSSIPTPA